LKRKYQRTHRMMISRSKCRPVSVFLKSRTPAHGISGG
jgi:hypothetical protein